MEGKEITIENSSLEESKDLLKLPIYFDNTKFLLKIFPSKDNITLIFKLEKEKIQTYYYYAKYDLDDFKLINKKFSQEINIKNIYYRMKDIIINQTCKLEKKGIKYDVIFMKKNKEKTAVFTLKKKIVAQERLNDLLIIQIQEDKAKIKVLKKQIAKLDKTIQNKNDIIDNINNEIINLSEVVTNLNIKAIEAESNSKITQITPSKENDDEIKKTYPINKEENELLKKNLTLTQEKKQVETQESTVGARYISNNRKKKNKPKKTKNGQNQNSKEENKNKNNNEDALFCLDNEVYKNKKAYESLILFNFISILIVMYLLCSIYALKSNLTLGKMRDQELMKKVTLLSLLDDGSDDELGGIRENIVDFNLKNDDSDSGDNSGTNKNEKTLRIKYIKTKLRENKEISLLKDEKDKRFFKKDIRKKIHKRVRDVKFELRFNSAEEYKYHSFYNNYRDMQEILLLLTNKNGKKFGIFSNNIIYYQQNPENKDYSYSGYIYKAERYYEMNMKEFMNSYGTYIQNILDYLKNEHLRIKKKSSSSNFASKQLLGDVDMFEIYEVKYVRNY